MAKPEIVGPVGFGSQSGDNTWPMFVDKKEVGKFLLDDGYQAYFPHNGYPYTSISMNVFVEISVERKRRVQETLVPSDWLTFTGTMDPHALDIKRQGMRFGSLQWHDGLNAFLVVLYPLASKSDILVSVDDIDQIIRKRDSIVAAHKRT